MGTKKKDMQPMTLEQAFYALLGRAFNPSIPDSNSSMTVIGNKKSKLN